jgi:hypothetical protein
MQNPNQGPMPHDAAWHARISRVLSGALRVWGVSGNVGRDPRHELGFVVATTAGTQIRIVHGVPGGWEVFLRDGASGAEIPLGEHAGLPGLLRQLREELAPHAAPGRLVIGSQSLL